MESIRRKILLDEGYKMVTLHPHLCKWGTHSVVLCYLFDKPTIGLVTKAIKWNNNKSLMHERVQGVMVTDIYPDDGTYTAGLVFLEMF